MSLRKLASTTGAALLLLTANAVSAQDLQVKQWASACANCHGTNGKAVGAAPALAGQPAAELVKKMAAYKTGAVPATIMHQIAKGYTDAQIEAMAAFFAAQK
jgi:cytochrome subunit of sulfide dehydrogenase